MRSHFQRIILVVDVVKNLFNFFQFHIRQERLHAECERGFEPRRLTPTTKQQSTRPSLPRRFQFIEKIRYNKFSNSWQDLQWHRLQDSDSTSESKALPLKASHKGVFRRIRIDYDLLRKKVRFCCDFCKKSSLIPLFLLALNMH